MKICDPNLCTACYACVNVCSKHAISMLEDEYGELHPNVDEELCVKCGRCVSVCPNNDANLHKQYPLLCYASWITDNKKREKCSSGGIATILSEYVLSKGGVVYGTAYDEFFVPQVMPAKDLSDIERFKGSKYAQSIVGEDTLKEIKQILSEKVFVLFIGTPCQVAGLKSFLGKDFDNLITADLICHGVCPTKYFQDEINFITKKKRIKKIRNIRFRSNDSFNYCLTIWTDNERNASTGKLAYSKERYESPYFAGFMLGITLRKNCYNCRYAVPERIGDITIGDFLRLGKEKPFPYKVKQSSVVLLNNSKSVDFYKEMACQYGDQLVNVEREYSERLVYRPSLLEPFEKHPLYYEFRKLYKEKGYVRAIRSVLRVFILKKIFIRKKKAILSITKRCIKMLWIR